MIANGSPGNAQFVPGRQGNVLLLSMRRLEDLVAFCVPYEFEDVFAEVTGADRVDAGDREAMKFSRRVYKLARLATGSRRFARAIAPDLPVSGSSTRTR